MTISTEDRVDGPYISTGTGPFNITFHVQNVSDILVVRTSTTGVDSELTLTTDYTVSLNPDQDTSPGGTITLVNAQTNGEKTTVTSRTTATQNQKIRNLGKFLPAVINDALDKLTILVQELRTSVDRTVRFPVSDDLTSIDLPTAALRANRFVGFDSDGDITVSDQTITEIESGSTTAQAWATKTDGAVDGAEYSAKAYALGGTGVSNTAARGAAKEWATKTGGTVDGTEYSAKHYSGLAAGDRVQTGLDRVQTGLDRVQTGLDVVAADAAAAAAASAAAGGLYNEVISKSFADSPVVPLGSEEGALYRIDCTGGNVVVNLSALASYAEDMKFGFVKTDGTANTVTINRGGSDIINGGTSVVISNQWEVHALVGAFTSGSWVDVIQTGDIADGAVTSAKLADGAVTTNKIADGNVTLAKLANQAASSVLMNATNGAAPSTAVTLSASQLVGRGATGDGGAIALGTNLSMSGNTLNAAGSNSPLVANIGFDGTQSGAGGVSFSNNLSKNRTGIGVYSFTFGTNQPDTAYIPHVMARRGGVDYGLQYDISGYTASGFTLNIWSAYTNLPVDPVDVRVSVLRYF